MKIWLQLLLGVVALIALLWVLSTVVGLLYWLAIVLAVGGIVTAVARYVLRDRRNPNRANRAADRRVEKRADRALKAMEGRVNAERERQD